MLLAGLRAVGPLWVAIVTGVATLVATATTLTAYLGYPLIVPAGLALGILCVVTYRRPAIGVGAALLLIATESLPVSLPVSPTEATMAIVAICWGVRAAARPGSVALPAFRDVTVIALLVSVAAGIALAESKAPIFRVATLWFLFYLVYLQCQTFTDREIRFVLIAFAIGVGVVGAVGVLEYLRTGPPQLYDGGLGTGARAAGAFGDANYSASMLALGVIPATALVVLDPRRLYWLVPILAAATAGIVLSLSRGGFLALAAGIAVLTLWGRFRVASGVVLLLVLAVGVFSAEPISQSAQFSAVSGRLGTLTGSGLGQTSLRPRIWAAAIDTGLDAPVFGVGVQNFTRAAAQRGIFEGEAALENVHNIPLNLLAENGFVGMIGFLAFVWQLAVRGGLAARRSGALSRALGLGLVASLAGFLVQGATLMSLRVNAIAAVFFVFAGLLTALSDRLTMRSEPIGRSTEAR